MLPVVILAGGLATRLRPVTATIPKALLDVGGLPFICRQLDYLYQQGVRHVVLCIGYLGEMIQSVVGDGSQFGLTVTYSSDGPVLLGTGGSIRQALPILGNEFFVLYGDSFLPIEFTPVERAYLASPKAALMTVLKNNNHWDKSNVVFRQGQLLEYNKKESHSDMTYIDYGLSVLSSKVLLEFPLGQPFDLAEIYHALSVKGELEGYEVKERFYEIGSHSGLKETEEYFFVKEKV